MQLPGNDWYNSGNTAYTVKEIGTHFDDPAISLTPEKPAPTILTPGCYIVKTDKKTVCTPLKEGMVIPKFTEVAYLDKNRNKLPFEVKDGDNICFIQEGDVYYSGGSAWKVHNIKNNPNYKFRVTLTLVAP